MSEPSRDPVIRRVVIALDASPHSRAALEAAAEIAADLQAELHGLFVEDVNLLRAAALPFTHEFRSHAAAPAELSSLRLRGHFRAQAEQARAWLEEAARRAHVGVHFRVVRGFVPAELIAASAEADLFLIGKAGSRSSSRRKLGSTARAVLEGATAPTLVVRYGLRLGHPVLVLYDEGEHAGAALRLAARLALRREGEPLTVLLLDDDAQDGPLRAQLDGALADLPPGLPVHRLAAPQAAHVADLARAVDAGLVVVPAAGALLQGERLQRFLHEVDRPVLFVR